MLGHRDVGRGRFFADQAYHFQTLRVLNDITADGADTSEVLETIKPRSPFSRRIPAREGRAEPARQSDPRSGGQQSHPPAPPGRRLAAVAKPRTPSLCVFPRARGGAERRGESWPLYFLINSPVAAAL